MKKVYIRYAGGNWIISNEDGYVFGVVSEPELLIEKCNKEKYSIINSDALTDIYRKQLIF